MDKNTGIIIMNWLKDKLTDAALSGNRKEVDTIIQIMKLWKKRFYCSGGGIIKDGLVAFS